jgi:murein DD-endopeptidase MepM/ murein hydrolase activator NlpD
MKLYRSVQTNKITQPFGANYVPYYKEWGMKGHNGVDFAAQFGEPVYFDCIDCEGKVISLSENVNEGLGVVVITEDKDGIFQHRFWHLKEIKCKVGQILSTADLIGLADTTGKALGCHLHRDLKPMEKTQFGYQDKFPDNGYFGAIDLMPFFTNIFVKDYMDILIKQESILEKMIQLIKDFFSNKGQ